MRQKRNGDEGELFRFRCADQPGGLVHHQRQGGQAAAPGDAEEGRGHDDAPAPGSSEAEAGPLLLRPETSQS